MRASRSALSRRGFVWSCVLAVVTGSAGCREVVEITDVCDKGEGLFFPLDHHAWWQYEVHKPGGTEQKAIFSDGVEKQVPNRTGAMGYEVLSIRETKTVYRWQTVIDGGVYRILDVEEYVDEPAENEVEHFCPMKLRIPDGEQACEGWSQVEKVDVAKVAMCTAGAAMAGLCTEGEASWEECKDTPIDPDTCMPEYVDDGCMVTREENRKHWEVVSVGKRYRHDESVVTRPAGANAAAWQEFHPMVVQNRSEKGLDGGEGSAKTIEFSRFKWERGLGKVHEDGGVDEEEWLVDFCFFDTNSSCETVEQLTARVRGE